MNRYESLLASLAEKGAGTMKCSGNSMLPILSNPCTNEYRRQKEYRTGDIVFCRVRGRYIDAKDGDRYLISNNHGRQNGWTRTVYGRVVKSTDAAGNTKTF